MFFLFQNFTKYGSLNHTATSSLPQGYYKKSFSDEFKGPEATMSKEYIDKCFNSEPTCKDYYGPFVNCSENSYTFTKLKNMNKCNWQVARMINWMSPVINQFDPNEVEVDKDLNNGVMILKAHSIMPDGQLRNLGRNNFQSGHKNDIGYYRSWMNSQGYNCEGINDVHQRKCPIQAGLVHSNPNSFYGGGGFEQQYGIFQVRGKLSYGDGSWPAFWMLPNASWPGGGEFDLMESWNQDLGSQNYHTGICDNSGVEDLNGNCPGGRRWHLSKGGSLKGKDTPTQKSLLSSYHTYTLNWKPNRIEFLIDGIVVNTVNEGEVLDGSTLDVDPKLNGSYAAHIPQRPFHFLLNLSVGGNFSGVDPELFKEQRLFIDYVRTWKECQTPQDFCSDGGIFKQGYCYRGNGSSYVSQCTKCLHGGSEAGPNCQLKSFPQKSKIYPGEKYWVDTDPRWPGVYYKQINNTCLYGGSISGNGNCQLESWGTTVEEIPTVGVKYWVDADQRWPGIYYKQVNNKCVYGGTLSGGGNCQWKSINNGLLNSQNKYWVDTDPRWPGIYYKQVNNKCSYGGTISGGGNCQLIAWSYSEQSQKRKLANKINYWVDSDPRWPGIYYKNIKGTCALGGSVSGHGNCQLVAYPGPHFPFTVKGVNYWVDADLRWPGVYYKQVNQKCIYGGTISGNGNCQLLAIERGLLEDQIKYWVDTDPRWPGVFYSQKFK